MDHPTMELFEFLLEAQLKMLAVGRAIKLKKGLASLDELMNDVESAYKRIAADVLIRHGYDLSPGAENPGKEFTWDTFQEIYSLGLKRAAAEIA